jgi:signal transduction histidine kinase
MNRQNIKNALLALGALIVFVVLSVQAQRINVDTHNQYRAGLRQLEGFHAVLNENVLRAKLGLLTFYDPLNKTLNTVNQLRDQLGHVPSFIGEQGQRDVQTLLQEYDKSLIDERNLVERFKTENAVLINSLSYFTIVVSDLTSKTAETNLDPTVKDALNGLLQDILLYNTTTESGLVPRIQEHIELLQRNQSNLNASGGSVAIDLRALVNHTNIVIQRKSAIDAVIADMFKLPISKQISDLTRVYDAYYEVVQQETNFYQIALYVFSLVLIGLIALAIIASLRKSAAIVSEAKTNLEATNVALEKRSEELEVANTELQKATLEAHEASRLKDEFLAVMSHELRTPLNAIIGFQGILLMNGKLEERATHMIQRAQANAKRLLSLINDILDISRIESGRLQLTPVDVSIAQSLEAWRAEMSVLAEQKGLAFSVNVDQSMPAKIYADEDAVTKIVTNLVGNAFKFTEQGEVVLDLRRSNGDWIIKVSDTGIGIPVHMQQIIFERFRQVDGSAKRKYGGSGLGLAIVYNLCKAMNGTVTVQSVPNKGSTFTVTLPLETTEDESGSYGAQ